MENITKNFTFEELTNSATAKRLGIDNTPNEKERESIIKLAKEVLQPIRDAWKAPLIVTSGFRCEKLNNAVGGAKNSQHKFGEAADFKATKPQDNGKLYRLIQSMVNSGKITCGQCIWEYGNAKNPQWVHISLPNAKHKNVFFRVK